ncbi:thymosin beta cib [Brevipalpus obovatus]|uniref:thymosin beta cib n=1 Tax=Brevipalpus obovatus TaxID=246614 RepID=UPI003D9F055C
MSSPVKPELPKIADGLKNELTGEHHLKHALTEEKNPLPSKEDIETEKEKVALFKEVEEFKPDNLKHTETEVKVTLPTKEVIEEEKKAAQQ